MQPPGSFCQTTVPGDGSKHSEQSCVHGIVESKQTRVTGLSSSNTRPRRNCCIVVLLRARFFSTKKLSTDTQFVQKGAAESESVSGTCSPDFAR
jgi:hypothetical protein